MKIESPSPPPLKRWRGPSGFDVRGFRLTTAGMTAVIALSIIGCKSPFDRTRDASGGGGTGSIASAPTFAIFSDELKSGGGAFEYPGGEGQVLSFSEATNTITRRSIRYFWSGEAVSNLACPAQNPTHNFAGFDLMHTPLQADYSATPGRDLTAGGTSAYGKVTFFARGSLSTNTYMKVEVASTESSDPCVAVVVPCLKLIATTQAWTPAQDLTCPNFDLSDAWNQYTIMLPATWLVNNRVKDFFKATFVFVDPLPGVSGQPPGQGGQVYFDKIQYEQ